MIDPDGIGNMALVVLGPLTCVEDDELLGDFGLGEFSRFDEQVGLRIRWLIGHDVAPREQKGGEYEYGFHVDLPGNWVPVILSKCELA